MTKAPIILVPGFWLGAWAWDQVAALLRAAGHDVTPLTLPGLESVDANRATVTLEDHIGQWLVGRSIQVVFRSSGSPARKAHSGCSRA